MRVGFGACLGTDRVHQHRNDGGQDAAENSHRLAALDAEHWSPPRQSRSSRSRRGAVIPNHSITSSARTSNAVGNVSPSVLAVLRLMINSTLVTCCTGRSAGFSPLRILPT